MASRPCVDPRSDDVVGDSRAELVGALRGLPGARVSVDEVPDEMFGYPATHLRMTFPDPPRKCQEDVNVLTTTRHGIVAGGDDSLRDVWVVDVDGNAILVAAGYSTRTPPEIRQELDEMRRLDRVRLPGVTRLRRGRTHPWRPGRGGTASRWNRSPYFSASSSARLRKAARPISPVSGSS